MTRWLRWYFRWRQAARARDVALSADGARVLGDRYEGSHRIARAARHR